MSDDTFYDTFPALARPRDPQLEAELQQLWAMSPDERVAAMRAERLTLHQLSAWSARHPDQVPRILTGSGNLMSGGEFEWIARYTPEIAEANDTPRRAPSATRSTG